MRLEKTYEQAEIHEAWESVYRGHPAQRAFNDRTMDRLARHIHYGPEGPVLDAGCGVGDHAFRLAAHGFDTVGIDVSEHVLEQARANAETLGLAERTTFVQGVLEDLPFEDGHFAGVHCRGVLMHIPDWETALGELCRVLRPGGRLVIIENNTTSAETALVRTLRLVRKGESEMKETPGGLEFWMEREGHPFVWRIARVGALTDAMRRHGVLPDARFATEFFDINRFGPLRGLAIRWNRLYYALRLPAFMSHGNAAVGVKQDTG